MSNLSVTIVFALNNGVGNNLQKERKHTHAQEINVS
jgi:hypothetical protein